MTSASDRVKRPSSPRDLILGASVFQKPEALVPFLASLKRTGGNASLVLFIGPGEEDVRELVESHQGRVFSFDSSGFKEPLPVNALRYYLYQQFLAQHGDGYDRVMLTDTRDVLFQRDPFLFDFIPGLHVFQEDIRLTLLGSDFNAACLLLKFGEQELRKLGQKPVVCSGITLGDTQSIRNYLGLMTLHLMPKIDVMGYDQGVHNYILYNHFLPGVVFHEHNDGPVYTMGVSDPSEPRFGSNGLLCGASGTPFNAIHQYDRNPAVAEKLSFLWKAPLP